MEKPSRDLKEWTQEETEGKQADAGTGPEENSIDIQHASKDFQNLIDEYRPSVQVALNEVADSAKFLHANQSWAELRSWDQAFRCTNEGCDHLVSVDDLANHKGQFIYLAKTLIPEVRGTLTADLQSVYNDDNKLHLVLGKEEATKGRSRVQRLTFIGTRSTGKALKSFVKAVLESGEGRAVEATIQGTKHMATVKDRINTKNTGPLNQKELRVLSKNHSLLVQFALRLKTIERKVLHCRASANSNTGTIIVAQRACLFPHRIAGKIIRSIIETAVGNAVIRAPKSLRC